jgi:hypothetical protein
MPKVLINSDDMVTVVIAAFAAMSEMPVDDPRSKAIGGAINRLNVQIPPDGGRLMTDIKTVTVMIVPNEDDAHPYEVLDDYVELFWTPILGPSCVLLLRHLARVGRSIPQMSFEHLAKAVGLDCSRLTQVCERLQHFRLARWTIYDDEAELVVSTHLPGVGSRYRQLSPPLAAMHDNWNDRFTLVHQ